MNPFYTEKDNVQSYSEYKQEQIDKHIKAMYALMSNVASSSLKTTDKKELLVMMLNEVNKDLFTKF